MNIAEAVLQAAHNALAQCLKVKEGESVLIVSNHEKQTVADGLFQAAKSLQDRTFDGRLIKQDGEIVV